ncbi:MAG: C45 family peptidase [Patescibacteria group bacterium]
MFEIRNKKLKTIILSGSPKENGREIGLSLRLDIQKLLKRERKLLDATKNSNRNLLSFLRRKLTKLFPNSIAELQGMASGAKVDFIDLFLENCPELLHKEEGCTSAVVKNKKDFFIIHNEDEVRVRSASSVALVRYSGKKGERDAFLYGGELAGYAFGWAKDWFYCVNHLPVRKPDLRGVPRYFVTRQLLEQDSIAAVVKFLKSSDDASGFHYLMGDTDGEVVSVEKRTKDISIRSALPTYCHSNHYIHPKFKNLETIQTKSSLLRLSLAKDAIGPNTDQEEALTIWRNTLSRPFDKDDYGSKTFATVIADLKQKTISIY